MRTKNHYFYLFISALFLVLFSFSVQAFAGGSGTLQDPYVITTCLELQDIRDDLSAHYIVNNSFDCIGVSWHMIGGFIADNTPFTGSLDGQNYEISDLTINNGGQDNGMFSYVDDAQISNLYINGLSMPSVDPPTGGLIGLARGHTNITNCIVKNLFMDVSSNAVSGDPTGGLVGSVGESSISGSGGTRISDCNVTGDIEGYPSSSANGGVGGLVGAAYYGLTIDNSHVDATVTGWESVGGILGKAGDSSSSSDVLITDSTFSGEIETQDNESGGNYPGKSGGIIGNGRSNITIRDCDVRADIYGGTSMGGIAGYLRGTSEDNWATIDSCSFIGDVNCSYTYCGGIVAEGSARVTVNNSYAAAGTIQSLSGRVGGISGFLDVNSTVDNSYARMKINGTSFVGGLVGYAQDVQITNSFRAMYYGINYDGSYVGGIVGYLNKPESSVSNVWWNEHTYGNASSCYYDEGESSYSNASCSHAGSDNTRFYHYTLAPISSWDFPPWSTENSGIQTPTLLRSDFSGGSGTPEDPYIIDSPEQFGSVGSEPGGHYFLPNGTITVDPGSDPIGTPENPFTGSMIGNGTIITGVDISGPGFFGNIENGTVANITLKGNVSGGEGTGGFAGNVTGNSTIDNIVVNMTVTGGNTTGGFAGRLDDDVSITNVTVNGGVTGGNTTGGFAGTVGGTSFVKNIVVTGNVTGENKTGGVVGVIEGSGQVINASNSGNVTGNETTGGVAGIIKGSAIIRNSSSTGKIVGNKTSGGIVGKIDDQGKIEKSFASGNVQGEEDVGGCIGVLDDSAVVQDIYCRGDVTGNIHVGGLVGRISENSVVINNTYATGLVVGTTHVGGLVGYNPPTGTVLYSFYDQNTTEQNDNVGKGTPKTTYWMKYIFTYYNSGWDMNSDNYGWDSNTWGIHSAVNDGYPFLKWEGYSSRGLFNGGAGTNLDPYDIELCNYLNETEFFLNDHFDIPTDLSCSNKRAIFGENIKLSVDMDIIDSYFSAPDFTLETGSSINVESSVFKVTNRYVQQGATFVMRGSADTSLPGDTLFDSVVQDVYTPNVILIYLSADDALSFEYCYTTDASQCSPHISTPSTITLSGVGDYTVCAKSKNLYGEGEVICSLADAYTISNT